jgi:hypothetical protein
MKTLIGWVGTIVVAGIFAIIVVTILTPLFAFIERTMSINLIGVSRPNDFIYLFAWVVFIFALHWFVFRKRKYKRRVK